MTIEEFNAITALSDEELDSVSGGGQRGCPFCGMNDLVYSLAYNRVYCGGCAYTITPNAVSNALLIDKCPKCKQSNLSYSFNSSRLVCGACGYSNFHEFHELFVLT